MVAPPGGSQPSAASAPIARGPAPAAAVGVSDVSISVEQKSQPKAVAKPSAAPAAASSSSTATDKRPKAAKTKFGVWSHNMALITASVMFVMGCCGLMWSDHEDETTAGRHQQYELLTSVYAMVLSFAVVGYEYKFGLARTASRFPIRGLIYIAMSIFCFFAMTGYITGVFLVATGVVNIVAVIYGEEYDVPPEARRQAATKSGPREGIWESIVQWAIMMREQNKVGVLIFLSLYFAANVIIFVVILIDWLNTNKSLPAEARLSDMGPLAKAFGNLLDFNCSLILMPVLRSMLRWLYNRSTADQGIFARFLRSLLAFMPVDRNLAFHKLIAKVIVFAAFGHTIMHFFNYALRPAQTMALFGLWPWISGGIICFCMLMIYSAAFENVKRGQFEIFWYNHHFFVLFFVMLIIHGKGGFSKNFWKWFVGPGSLYVLERLLRIYRASQPVVVLSVTNMKPCVFSLEFAKEGVFSSEYKEGQYIFLQAPSISGIQWHPFTISSAPQENSVTVHIRICGPGSWTEQLQKMFLQMGPPNSSYFSLTRQTSSGKLAGKILGPDGKPMLAIDGPHSAPTQHISEYDTVMVIGAGIGVTPVASTLKSIVFYKWKYTIGNAYPDNAYFVWVCGYGDIDAFRWLIKAVKESQDEVVHMRATNPASMAKKSFEFHIYVTSVPKDAKPVDVVVDDDIGFWGVPHEDAKVNKTRANFDESDIYRVMKSPAKHTQLGDIHIYAGRPDWDPRFDAVAQKHPVGDVGVTYCGNSFIAKDLAKACHRISHGRQNGGLFILHKENF